MQKLDTKYFMRQAINEAEKALNKNEFPVGAVIVCENRIIAYGSRAGTSESLRDKPYTDNRFNELDHAEINAIRNLMKTEYENNITFERNKMTLFCTLEPCLMCYAALIINGIHDIVYAYEDAMGGGTSVNLKTLAPLYCKAEVNIMPNVLRSESLKLFKTFFSCENNNYLKNTLLAQYSLLQEL